MCRIGLDIGGTNIKAGILDDRGKMICDKSCPTEVKKGRKAVIQNMVALIMELMEETGISFKEVSGIGIGSAGIIDNENGLVIYSNNFGWENIELVKEMKKMIPCPIRLANDAQCAALGELKAGAAKSCNHIVLLTLGTGLGSGIIMNGKIFQGGHPGGGILGHNLICKGGKVCSCGRKGCAETYVSASALIRDTKEMAKKYPDSKINQICKGDFDQITGKTPFDAARDGDPYAKEIIHKYIEYLGDEIVNIVNVFRPDKILISGGICNQGKMLTSALNVYIKENCFAGARIYIPPVECAALGNKAGIVGAAYLNDIEML